jgi:steroid delta-isomerase-like uncharacterized protein
MNVETLIRAYFEAFNRHDLEGMVANMAPEIKHQLNQGEDQIGIEAFRKFKTYMDTCYREQITDLNIMVGGHLGCAEFTCSGTYLATDGNFPEANGQTYAIKAAAIFEESEGKVTRITSYYNVPEWVAQISG